jgi:hypothetical protein
VLTLYPGDRVRFDTPKISPDTITIRVRFFSKKDKSECKGKENNLQDKNLPPVKAKGASRAIERSIFQSRSFLHILVEAQ